MNSYKIIVIDNTRGLEAWSADIMAVTSRGSVMALAARLEATTHTAPVVKPTSIVGPSMPKHCRPDWLYGAATEEIDAVPCDDGMLASRLSVPIIPKHNGVDAKVSAPKRKSRHRKEK